VPAAKDRRRALALGQLRLVREPLPTGETVSDTVYIRSPKDVFDFMAPIAALEVNEVFWILALNAQHRLIGSAPIPVTRGILNSSLVSPGAVFRAAITAGAAAIILCHNHPSGIPTPSADDRMVTEQLVHAGQILDIPVHDHVVLGSCAYVSFAEVGLL
jgi:DNA repair protein RadC